MYYESKPAIMKRVIIGIILCCQTFLLSAGNTEVYPNPAQNNFIINSNSQIQFIEVYNYLGTKVIAEKFTSGNNQKINISSLAPGRYFVKVMYSNNQPEIVQLIKK